MFGKYYTPNLAKIKKIMKREEEVIPLSIFILKSYGNKRKQKLKQQSLHSNFFSLLKFKSVFIAGYHIYISFDVWRILRNFYSSNIGSAGAEDISSHT